MGYYINKYKIKKFRIIFLYPNASTGIGSLIIIISILLVCGIATTVLLQTGNTLQTQALKTGQDTKDEVSMGIFVKEIDGYVLNNKINKMEITITPRPWSNPIDLNEIYIKLSDGIIGSILNYNQSVFKIFNDSCDSNVFTTTISSGSGGSEGNWWDGDWNYRKKITIESDEVDDDLTNFPVLINLASDTGLADHAQNDGDDIAFADQSGTQLDHEIESFNGATGALVAWVRIPLLSGSTDTDIYMYYGNAGCSSQEDTTGAVWENGDYDGVWHLSEGGTGTRFDSTSNNNDGTPTSYDGDEATTGKIDGADDFDGLNDYISATDNSIDLSGDFTLECWVCPGFINPGTNEPFLSKDFNTGTVHPYTLEAQLEIRTNNRFRFILGSTTAWSWPQVSSNIQISAGTWYYVVAVSDGTAMDLYVNTDKTTTNNILGRWGNGNQPVLIGKSSDVEDAGIAYFDGIIDEIRVSSIARSAEWISTNYNMMNDNSAFITLGSEETSSSGSGGTITLFDLNQNEYGIYVIQDYDGSCTANNSCINNGDIIMLTINTQTVFNGIPPKTDIRGVIQTPVGTPGVILFKSPNAFTKSIIKLQ